LLAIATLLDGFLPLGPGPPAPAMQTKSQAMSAAILANRLLIRIAQNRPKRLCGFDWRLKP